MYVIIRKSKSSISFFLHIEKIIKNYELKITGKIKRNLQGLILFENSTFDIRYSIFDIRYSFYDLPRSSSSGKDTSCQEYSPCIRRSRLSCGLKRSYASRASRALRRFSSSM